LFGLSSSSGFDGKRKEKKKKRKKEKKKGILFYTGK
jgi:hypothetical protein